MENSTFAQVGPCANTPLRLGKFSPRGQICGPVLGSCACGSRVDLEAAAARIPVPGTSTRVCAVVRTYAGQAASIGTTLQTMRASARAAGRPLELEVHIVNTDPRPLPPCFRSRLSFEAKCAADGFAIHERFDDIARASRAWHRRWCPNTTDFGYIQTDFTLLDLRWRGGCDFIHVTNGDNIYGVDFFRRHLDELIDKHPTAVVSAADFFCKTASPKLARMTGGLNITIHVKYAIKHVDLASMVFRTSYLDVRNATFVVNEIEERGKPLSSLGMYAADGIFAERVAQDVGEERAREIHGHGPLLFHL